jgi:hypothetical protein
LNELGNNIAEAKLKYLMLNNSNNTYLNDYQNGFYFGYNYRPENYSMINGSVCNNDYAYNGIIFGKFKCPKYCNKTLLIKLRFNFYLSIIFCTHSLILILHLKDEKI